MNLQQIQHSSKDIELLAYYLWEYRGGAHGNSLRDWVRAEEILAYKALYPTPPSLTCGIDDIKTGNGSTAGWTFFVIPSSEVSSFAIQAAKLLPPGKREFHACEMELQESGGYKSFLLLIREFLEKHPYSVICTLGADRGWQKLSKDRVLRLCNKALEDLGIADQSLLKGLVKGSHPLEELSRLLRLVGQSVGLQVEMDSDSDLAKLTTKLTNVSSKSMGQIEFIARLGNAYSTLFFPDAPRLTYQPSSIRILSSEQSFMIQAADVLGNFALAHAASALGAPGKRRKRKSEILEEIFGPHPKSHLQTMIAMDAGDEIELTAGGNLKFAVSDGEFYRSDLEHS